jgi:hypothetical protein
MARYNPPVTLNLPFKVLVQRADPDYEREKRDQVEFEFSNGRQFRHNPNTRGPYAED